jgi:hypothetical protein
MSLIAIPAAAQSTSNRPFAVGGIGGFSAGQGNTGGSVGGTISFDVSNRLTAEARGVYGDRGQQRNGVEVSGTMLFTLARSSRTSAYAGVGGGMYHTRLDVGNPGGGFDNDHGVFSFLNGLTMREVPRFYADRIRQIAFPTEPGGTRSFTDPALTFGAGLKINLTNRIFVAPDVRGLIVLSRGDHMTLVTMGASAGVRF